MTLPHIKIGNKSLSCLVLGTNPICGVSHQSDVLSSEMAEYFTMENAKNLLRRCESEGINAFQGRADRWILHVIREHWQEGGKMHFICQTASEMRDIRANIRLAVKAGACAVYHHGTETGNYWREGRIEELRDVMKTARDLGVAVGIGSHIPEIIEYIEEKGWDIDFYMTGFYNVYKDITGRRESYIISGIHHEDIFDDADRARMVETIMKTSKPCLAFKILGAGRKCSRSETVRESFRFAFSHIKPTDGVVVGMFPKYKDIVRENVEIVKQLTKTFPRVTNL
jgi:hypothetical protein